MKSFAWLLTIGASAALIACSDSQDFDGRFIEPDGLTSYEFMPGGEVQINKGGEDIATAHYQYDSTDNVITLSSDMDLPNHFLTLKEDGNLHTGDFTMTRGIDYSMLADSTWIGEQGEFVFAMTFTESEEGMATYSELVTYYEDEKTYWVQPDDSIARLSGNMLFIDLTQYEVSDVEEDSFKITIGNNSMVLHKQPKGAGISYREDYSEVVEEE
ncbi:hypothetical protein [Methylophaga sp. OBS3]|uniref:hypothetical protein n=1 Tax=Methylophaga sp. OBS3 TaxID=2991934 RepID=UPI00225516B8|nr:hypothetical protein [Methylophaga sp. OBS3]MCX4188990.1 hypothetical protein [Methylophaga sp. OBS3]